MSMPVAVLEVEEHGFAFTAADLAQDRSAEETQRYIRETLRIHRFFVFNWLVENGAAIPMRLMADSMHPPVGHQAVDRI
jgi:hypothetical protein